MRAERASRFENPHERAPVPPPATPEPPSRSEERAAPSRPAAQAGSIPGLDSEVAQRLHEAGYTSLEAMDEEDEERLADAADLTLDEARDLKRRVHRLVMQGQSRSR
jgi:hypothetical protein